MKILIADDHAWFRDSLKSLLEAYGYEVVGEAADGQEALVKCRQLAPDVVLMDLAMPGMDGLTAMCRLAADQPAVKVVVLTASDEEADLFAAIRAGAKGYLVKDLAAEDLVRLLERVEAGEPALAPALGRKLLESFGRSWRAPHNGHHGPPVGAVAPGGGRHP